jgi:hypothetical protein
MESKRESSLKRKHSPSSSIIGVIISPHNDAYLNETYFIRFFSQWCNAELIEIERSTVFIAFLDANDSEIPNMLQEAHDSFGEKFSIEPVPRDINIVLTTPKEGTAKIKEIVDSIGSVVHFQEVEYLYQTFIRIRNWKLGLRAIQTLQLNGYNLIAPNFEVRVPNKAFVEKIDYSVLLLRRVESYVIITYRTALEAAMARHRFVGASVDGHDEKIEDCFARLFDIPSDGIWLKRGEQNKSPNLASMFGSVKGQDEQSYKKWNQCIEALPELVKLTSNPQETIQKLEVTSTFMNSDKAACDQAIEMHEELDDLSWVSWLTDFGEHIPLSCSFSFCYSISSLSNLLHPLLFFCFLMTP